MSCEIKVGSKIKVLNKSGCSPWGDHHLSIGKEYTLTGIRNPEYVGATGEIGYEIDGQTLQESEFELVKEWKDMVCINALGYHNKLTVGKVYQVQDATGFRGEHMYKVKKYDDCSTAGRVFCKRFEEIVDGCLAPTSYTPNAVCIDPGTDALTYPGTNVLTCGKEYYIKDSTWGFIGGKKFVHVFDPQTGKELTECYASRFKDLECAPPSSLGSTVCEVEQPDGIYIVWSSTSNKAPSRTYATHRQARRVAREMSQKHVGDFYVMRAFNKYSITTTVNKETL